MNVSILYNTVNAVNHEFQRFTRYKNEEKEEKSNSQFFSNHFVYVDTFHVTGFFEEGNILEES